MYRVATREGAEAAYHADAGERVQHGYVASSEDRPAVRVRQRTAVAAVVLFALGACSAEPRPSPTEVVAPRTSSPTGSPPGSPQAETVAPTSTPEQAAWVDAGSLTLSRWSTRATTIAGGRLLVVGADNICAPGGVGPESAITEVGDPLTGRWVEGGPLPRPREAFILKPLPDGSALVIGGLTDRVEGVGFQSFSSTFRFDPDTLSWQRSGDLNVARQAPLTAVLADGRILVAGGWYRDGGSQFTALRSAEIFDPETATWTTTGLMANARVRVPVGGSAATLADGRVLVISRNADRSADLSAELYDPASGQWSSAGSPRIEAGGLVPLRDGGALAISGTTFGGYPDPTISLPDPTTGRTARFDPRSGTWRDAASTLGKFTDRSFVTLADGRVLAAGGQRRNLDPGQPAFVAEAELYDPASDSWVATAPLPDQRGGATPVLLADGSVVLVGGAQGAWPGGSGSCPGSSDTAIRYMPRG